MWSKWWDQLRGKVSLIAVLRMSTPNKQPGILRGLSTMCCCCIGSRKQLLLHCHRAHPRISKACSRGNRASTEHTPAGVSFSQPSRSNTVHASSASTERAASSTSICTAVLVVLPPAGPRKQAKLFEASLQQCKCCTVRAKETKRRL